MKIGQLKPWEVTSGRQAIYNPASKTRTWKVDAMRDLLLAHQKSGTPRVISRSVSGPDEDVRNTPNRPQPADVDMRCPLVLGSSQPVACRPW